MKVQCTHCSARYELADSLIPVGGARIKCPGCKEHFNVIPGDDDDRPDDFGDWDFREVTLMWRGLNTGGTLVAFNSLDDLEAHIEDGVFAPDSRITYDSETWFNLADISDLPNFMWEKWEEAGAGAITSLVDQEDSDADAPTANFMFRAPAFDSSASLPPSDELKDAPCNTEVSSEEPTPENEATPAKPEAPAEPAPEPKAPAPEPKAPAEPEAAPETSAEPMHEHSSSEPASSSAADKNNPWAMALGVSLAVIALIAGVMIVFS